MMNLQGVGLKQGAQWLSGRVLVLRPRGCGFEPHQHHCVVCLSKNINPSLVLVQPRKACPYITERLLMGRKESNQTNQFEAVWIQIRPDIKSSLIWIQTVLQRVLADSTGRQTVNSFSTLLRRLNMVHFCYCRYSMHCTLNIYSASKTDRHQRSIPCL